MSAMPLLSSIFWGVVRRGVFAVGWAFLWMAAGEWIAKPLLHFPQLTPAYWVTWLVAEWMTTWLISTWLYLRSFKFTCPVCQNPSEPMGVLGYLRGHGAHEWHRVA